MYIYPILLGYNRRVKFCKFKVHKEMISQEQSLIRARGSPQLGKGTPASRVQTKTLDLFLCPNSPLAFVYRHTSGLLGSSPFPPTQSAPPRFSPGFPHSRLLPISVSCFVSYTARRKHVFVLTFCTSTPTSLFWTKSQTSYHFTK